MYKNLGIIFGMANSILVVEDNFNLQKYLRELLLDSGYSAQVASDGVAALNFIKKVEPDLVILDLGLPDMAGETVFNEIRKKYNHIPVIILTGKNTTSDIVNGLNLGADDYITKPFVSEELLARVTARLRVRGNNEQKLKVGDLMLDNQSLEVKRSGKVIQLTPQEFKLLQYLMNNKGRILTRDMILNRVWLYSPDIETRVVDVYMGYLRKKIDSVSKKQLLHSIRGFGYMIKEG